MIDKITILSIKKEHTSNVYVNNEFRDLTKIANELGIYKNEYILPLLDVNTHLWEIEDKLRKLEKENRFDDEFIELARSVYKFNDKRAEIKRKINEETNSQYKEVKIY